MTKNGAESDGWLSEESVKKLLKQKAGTEASSGIDLDTSEQAERLPVTKLDKLEPPIELHTILLDTTQRDKKNHLRSTESYIALRDGYLVGEISKKEIEELFLGENLSTKLIDSIFTPGEIRKLDRSAAKLLLKDIKNGLVKVNHMSSQEQRELNVESVPEINEAQQKELTILYNSVNDRFTELGSAVEKLLIKDPLRKKYLDKDHMELAKDALQKLQEVVVTNKFVGVSAESFTELKTLAEKMASNLKNWKKELYAEWYPTPKKKRGDNEQRNKKNSGTKEVAVSTPIFEYLSQLTIKGMSDKAMEKRLFVSPDKFNGPAEVKKMMQDPAWRRTLSQYLQQRKKGLSPAGRRMTEMMVAQPDIKLNELNADAYPEHFEKFKDITKKLWRDFYISGKIEFDKKKNEYVLANKTDLDAKVSLFLLKLAQIPAAKVTKLIAPGEYVKGATTIDSGGISGATLQELQPQPDEIETASVRPTFIIDNNQPGRDLFETSSAKILYNLLKEIELIKESEVLRVLVDMSVADDNGRMISNQKQFESSATTLRGLHRYLSVEEIFNYLNEIYPSVRAEKAEQIEKEGKNKEYKIIYEAILDKKLPDEILNKRGTLWNKKELITISEQQATAIAQAKELFTKTDGTTKTEDELKQEGRLVISPILGKCLVFQDEQLLAGHDAVRAYFGDHSSYINYKSNGNNFLVNTHDTRVDLKELFENLRQAHSADKIFTVRGAMLMFLKKKGESSTKITLDEILSTGGVGEKELEIFHEALERRTIQKEVDKQILQSLTVWLEKEMKGNSDFNIMEKSAKQAWLEKEAGLIMEEESLVGFRKEQLTMVINNKQSKKV